MSRFKLIALIALITLAFGIALVGDALAGEKVKGRTVFYLTKFEKVEVADEEGHLIAFSENRGIHINLQGGTFLDGWLHRAVSLLDMNPKIGIGSYHGYGDLTDRDGDKIYYRSEGKRLKGALMAGSWEGGVIIVKGTGKWEGIQGKGISTYYHVTPTQAISDAEWNLELPR